MNQSIFQRLASALPNALKTLTLRFDKSPITTVDGMATFVQTRSSYIGQTALYGYLKTRMGTRFVELFEDEVFSEAIRDSAIKIFSSCLADLSVFAVATAMKSGDLSDEQAQSLAQYCYKRGLERGLTDEERPKVPADAADEFNKRLPTVHWANAAEGENAFKKSSSDLIRFAPVIDEFKELDEEIVTNSIRFRWRDVREQARKRLDGEAICAEWAANP